MSFRTCFAAALALIFAIAVSPARAAEKVTVGYTPGPDYLAAFTAQDQGFFAKHGIDATLQFTTSATTIPASLQAGSMQIGTPTLSTVISADANGLGLKVIAANIETGGNFHLAAILVRSEDKLTSAKDLEGKTVAVPGLYSFLHILFVKWLENHGVDPANVHIVEIAMPGMMDALKNHSADAVIPVDPFMGRIIGSGAGRVLANYIDDFPPGILPTVYTVSSAYAEKHAEAIKGFRDALKEGLAYHQAHPEAAAASLARYMNLPIEIAQHLPLPRYVIDATPAQIQFWIDLMKEQKMLNQPVDAAALLEQP
ncbi:MAG TPA: ABC transporter substrate-binding protein [Stellaceae bacterium]|nr:ABC transporter substrate-binding protein [Stellaceae bacterium]